MLDDIRRDRVIDTTDQTAALTPRGTLYRCVYCGVVEDELLWDPRGSSSWGWVLGPGVCMTCFDRLVEEAQLPWWVMVLDRITPIWARFRRPFGWLDTIIRRLDVRADAVLHTQMKVAVAERLAVNRWYEASELRRIIEEDLAADLLMARMGEDVNATR